MNNKNWEILQNLDFVTIVCIGSRPGSDFMHSLFDAHPQILTIDGHVFYHKFYEKALSLWGLSAQFRTQRPIEDISLKDFFYEFAWHHLEKFNPKYDNIDLKGKLGTTKSESNITDIDTFVQHAVTLIEDNEFNRKNALLAIYGAFALTRNENLADKKIIFHHLHHTEMLPPVIEDFPEAKVIGATRDPRAGYRSQILGWLKYSPDLLDPGVHTYILERILREGDLLTVYPNIDIRVNLLEKLHEDPEHVMKNACEWLNIAFNPILLKSTWGGKSWWGDALSAGDKKDFNPNLYSQSKIVWHEYLSFTDQVIISSLMRKKIKQYGYDREYTNPLWLIILPIFIILPNRFELKSLKQCFKISTPKSFLTWIYAFIKRIYVMFKKYFKIICGKETSFTTLN